MTIAEFQKGLRDKEFTAVEAIKKLYEKIRAEDPIIGAFLNLLPDLAISQAQKTDAAVSKGEDLPPLMGVPLAIKDNIMIKGQTCTAASKILEHYTASYNATVVEKLQEQGAVFIGKTNLDEFAMGSSTENSALGQTRNPRDPERVPGGSSGGSAAAVAAGFALGAFGSDTGGSIRQPAAFCGVVGLKPTYGAVSRYGLMAMSSSLDQIGSFANTVEDASLLFRAIRGKDRFDSTSTEAKNKNELISPDFSAVKNFKLGLPAEYFGEGMEGYMADTLKTVQKQLEDLGIKFTPISLPHTKYALSTYYIIQPAEVSANLARYDGIRYEGAMPAEYLPEDLQEIYLQSRGRGLGAEVKRRIILGTFVLSSGYHDAYYKKAQQVRALISQDFENAFQKVDAIFAPVTPHFAFK
ncbi:MAG: Asp-tRNA(Asn)/Glu-tRNA(Gln) amidotransferase subunit GatA, partial [Candidatus Liptonbacteria bacterium]